MPGFWIDIEDASGNRYGDGPILTARYWESSDCLDRAGRFRFEMPLADPRAALVQEKRRARCWTVINGVVTEIGSGVIDVVDIQVSPQGKITLVVEGDSLARELTYRHVGGLAIDDGVGGVTTDGPQLIMALAPTGWSLDTATGHDETIKEVLHTFQGESVLAALVRLASLSGEHFRLGSGRKVVWMQNDQADSTVRAIQGGDAVSLENNHDVCLITDLKESRDTYDGLVGRLYAGGVGNGDTLVDLNGAVLPAAYATLGYTLGTDSKGSYLEHTDTWTAYQIEQYTEFKDIESQDMLVEQAYELMRRQLVPQKAYDLSVTKLDKPVYPGSTIRVIYKKVRDGVVVLDIDADLVVLELATRIDENGLRSTGLKVATVDKWPGTDADMVIAGVGNAETYYTHPQPLSGSSHHASHQNGGADEINVGGLSGVLADPQTPAAHTHPFSDLTETPLRWRGSGTSTPSSPQEADVWNDTNSGNVIKIYANGDWRALN